MERDWSYTHFVKQCGVERGWGKVKERERYLGNIIKVTPVIQLAKASSHVN